MNPTRAPQPCVTHGNDTATIGNEIASLDDGHFDGKQVLHAIVAPQGSAYIDRVVYRSIHFYGSRLCESLIEAARYLIDMERINGEPPFVLALQHHRSSEDRESDLTWQVTLVIGLLGTP